MPVLQHIALDRAKIDDGRTVVVFGITMKLRSFRCAAYKEAIDRLRAPHRAAFAAAGDSPLMRDLNVKLTAQAFSDARMVVEWDATNPDGSPIPCSGPEFVATLLDPRFDHFFAEIIDHAKSTDGVLVGAEVADAGNSEAGSAGT